MGQVGSFWTSPNMIATLRANHLAMRIIVTSTTVAWVGALACIAHSSGKGAFGGDLPDWIPLTTDLTAMGGVLLTLLTSGRLLFDRRESCILKDLISIWYGFSAVGALALVPSISPL